MGLAAAHLADLDYLVLALSEPSVLQAGTAGPAAYHFDLAVHFEARLQFGCLQGLMEVCFAEVDMVAFLADMEVSEAGVAFLSLELLGCIDLGCIGEFSNHMRHTTLV
jgi:hypothetical protein